MTARDKAGLVFYKCDDLWVVPTQGRTPDGFTIHIEPVVLVQHDDVQGLIRAILEKMHREVQVPEPDRNSALFKRTVMAKALNLKTYRAFHERARSFYVEKSPDELSIQEWKKAPRLAFTTPALWKRAFGTDDIDELVWFLVKHEDVAIPTSPPSTGHAAVTDRKRARARN